MQSFTRTLLERDIPIQSPRVSPEAVGRCWRMLAHIHGQVWNASALGHSMGVGVTAVNKFRDLLSGAFMEYWLASSRPFQSGAENKRSDWHDTTRNLAGRSVALLHSSAQPILELPECGNVPSRRARLRCPICRLP